MRRVVVPLAALLVAATACTATPERPAPTRTTEQAACPVSTEAATERKFSQTFDTVRAVQ